MYEKEECPLFLTTTTLLLISEIAFSATDNSYGNVLFINLSTSHTTSLKVTQFTSFVTFTYSTDSQTYVSIADASPVILSSLFLTSTTFYIQDRGTSTDCIWEDSPCAIISVATQSPSEREVTRYTIAMLTSTIHPPETNQTEWTSGITLVVQLKDSEGMRTKTVSW